MPGIIRCENFLVPTVFGPALGERKTHDGTKRTRLAVLVRGVKP